VGKIRRSLLTAALALTLAGCGIGGAAGPVAHPAATGVARSSEQGGRFLAFVGPRRQHAEPFLGVPGTNFFALRSWLDLRSGETVHQLYVSDSYFGAERNWNAARDDAGQELRFVPISKNEITCDNGCSYVEEFAAALPEPLLRARPRGLAVVFTGKSGDKKTIEVPGELVEQQLKAIAEARATLPAAAAAP
jgi:predicted small lipoprotein YifL